jgi:hypothetical protein
MNNFQKKKEKKRKKKTPTTGMDWLTLCPPISPKKKNGKEKDEKGK